MSVRYVENQGARSTGGFWPPADGLTCHTLISRLNGVPRLASAPLPYAGLRAPLLGVRIAKSDYVIGPCV
jgi:hypothetical protein